MMVKLRGRMTTKCSIDGAVNSTIFFVVLSFNFIVVNNLRRIVY